MLSTTTKIVQRMTAEGLAITWISPSDGRVTEVSLTDADLEAVLRAANTAKRVCERTFSEISEDEMKQVNQVLKKIFERLI
ncbi:MarR family winged helix-turn-helix transcriptional regulator [Breoghania sp.]|uniref:MarR family winged helix-turn-helix transcriptional regulator n=1 Tax=Breoghania sp. TaxID=2065378 RepID=UPI00262306D8|nr:MarR family winged helix-turn-helix transcriptional regulator [Breoghania sp.]MDJ0933099.1 MarR family winged helix-turn-helix transcriptional regulator [Breoghania sp.]